MSEPLTKAGRALLVAIKAHDFFEAESAIAAIEAEAAAPSGLRGALEGLLTTWRERAVTSYHAHAWSDAVEELEAALAAHTEGAPEGLDVQRLANALHKVAVGCVYGARGAVCGPIDQHLPRPFHESQAIEIAREYAALTGPGGASE